MEEGYRSLLFPLEEYHLSDLVTEAVWTLDGLLGYVST